MTTRISALPALSTVTATTVIPVVDSGATKRVTAAALATYITGTVVASSVPGGSSTHVQFNNSGAFAGSSNLVWDNSNGRLGVGTTSPNGRLEIYDSSVNTPNFFINSGYNGAQAGSLTFRHGRTNAALSANDSLGDVVWQGFDSANGLQNFGSIGAIARTVTSGSAASEVYIKTYEAGSSQDRLRFQSNYTASRSTRSGSNRITMEGTIASGGSYAFDIGTDLPGGLLSVTVATDGYNASNPWLAVSIHMRLYWLIPYRWGAAGGSLTLISESSRQSPSHTIVRTDTAPAGITITNNDGRLMYYEITWRP